MRRILSAIPAVLLAALPCASAEAGEAPRTISVSGSASERAQPDMARLTFTVDQARTSAAEAREAVAEVIGRLVALLDRMEVAREDVNTTRMTISTEHRRPTRDAEAVLYFRVARSVEVTVRDLDGLEDLLQQAIETGVTRSSGPHLDLSTRPALEERVLRAAADDARRTAETLAGRLGARVGAPRDVRIGPPRGKPFLPAHDPFDPFSAGAEAAAPVETHRVGQIEVTTAVEVTFDLIPE